MAQCGAVGAPWWDDKPVAIIGWGPSVAGLDLTRLAGRFHVLAVKGAIFELPFATAGFGLDAPRYDEWELRFAALPFPIFWALDRSIVARIEQRPGNVTFLHRVDVPNLSDEIEPSLIFSGGTSGFGALNLAVLKRARRIVLFGFDYRPSADGRWRADDAAYGRPRDQNEKSWAIWAKEFDRIAPALSARGIAVLNASPSSAIHAFPTLGPEEAIQLGDAAFEYLDRVRQPAV